MGRGLYRSWSLCPGVPWSCFGSCPRRAGEAAAGAESRRGQTPTELTSLAIQGPRGRSGRFGRGQERGSSPGGLQLPRASGRPVAELLRGCSAVVATNDIFRCAMQDNDRADQISRMSCWVWGQEEPSCFCVPGMGAGSGAGGAAGSRGRCPRAPLRSAEPGLPFCWPQQLWEVSEKSLHAPKGGVIAGSTAYCR